MRINILIIVAVLFNLMLGFGQTGRFDPTFGNEGLVTTNFSSARDKARAIAIQADGKIVAAGSSRTISGWSHFALARYTIDGKHDHSFGQMGKVKTEATTQQSHITSLAIQKDSKILAAGYGESSSNGPDGLSSIIIIRYHTDGSLDHSFGNEAKVTTNFGNSADYCFSMILQEDGKILVVGRSTLNSIFGDFVLVRYNSDGSLDQSFGQEGKVLTDFGERRSSGSSIAIQTDGKILIAGTAYTDDNQNVALARYHNNGIIDQSFGKGGKVTTDFNNNVDSGWSIAIQADGKILVAGGSINSFGASDFVLVRYQSDGQLDSSFGNNGKIITIIGSGSGDDASRAGAVSLQADDKILLAGNVTIGPGNSDFGMVRYLSDGNYDPSFGTEGIVISDLGGSESGSFIGMSIQNDGKILITGGIYYDETRSREFVTARYLSSEITIEEVEEVEEVEVKTIDFCSEDNTVLIFPNPVKENITLEYKLLQEEIISIYLYDSSGRLIKPIMTQSMRSAGVHKENILIDSSIAAGNYVLVMDNNFCRVHVKIVKILF